MNFRTFIVFLSAVALTFPLQELLADPPKGLQSGEIGGIQLLEEAENTYPKVQDRVIAKVSALEKSMLNLAAGSATPIPDFDAWELNYLSAVYLFCSMQTGVCPRVLQMLFEVDLINSQLEGKSSCPNLTRLWKNWVSADMERRLEYKIKAWTLAKQQKFKKEARPKFVRCRKTIEVVRGKYPAGVEMFSKRYTDDSTQIRAVQKTLALLNVVKKKVKNVFYKTGVKGS